MTIDSYRKPKAKFDIPMRAAERAATKYVEIDSGCWISGYSAASHGYAQIGWKGDDGRNHVTTAHRAAWVFHSQQQIPEGHTVDHVCKTQMCVNPAHLRLLSNFENARRTFGDDWGLGTCKNGHPDTELISIEAGKRVTCGVCYRTRRDRKNANDRARRAAMLAAK